MDTVQPATNSTAPTAINPPITVNAPKSPAVGWRALLAVAATGVVGVTALVIPQVRNNLEQEATTLGRQALAHELASLEGITLDEAIKAAEITNCRGASAGAAAGPVGSHYRGDGLAVLLAALTTATHVLGSDHITVARLSGLRDMVASWHEHIASLPIALTNYRGHCECRSVSQDAEEADATGVGVCAPTQDGRCTRS